MKLALSFAFAAAAMAQDGTKGNITVQTMGDSQKVAVSITDADQSVVVFSVVLTYTVPCVAPCTPLARMETQHVSRIVHKAALAVFNVPLADVKGVLVTELKPAQTEMFQAQ